MFWENENLKYKMNQLKINPKSLIDKCFKKRKTLYETYPKKNSNS